MMVETLIHHGADVDEVDSKGTTPFIDACATGTVSDSDLSAFKNWTPDKLAVVKAIAKSTGDKNEPRGTRKSVLDIIYETPITAYEKFHVLLQLGEYVSQTEWRKYKDNMTDLALELKYHSKDLDIRTYVWKAWQSL